MSKTLIFGLILLFLTSVNAQIENSISFSKELSQVAHQVGISCDSLVIIEKKGAINSFDEKGRKSGYWIHFVRDSLGKMENTCQRTSEGNYLYGRKEGRWIQYYKDGYSPKSITPFERGRIAGDTILSFTIDSLKLKSIYSSGKMNGSTLPSEFTIFYSNGCIDKITTTDTVYHFANDCTSPDGKGTLLYKYPNMGGTVKMQSNCTFHNDTLDKPDDHPSIEKYLPYKNYSGYIQIYDPNHGQLLIEGDLIEGKIDNGFFYVYDEDNLLLKSKRFIQGQETFHCGG
jgi:antitoxin component YwqK of YwqJK toxin-antitoxin module